VPSLDSARRMMSTILLANRLAPELSPLTELICAALLRVAGKPLLIHAIESIAAARLTDIIVVVSPFADHVEKMLGDGARWGMRFTYCKARGDECPDGLIRGFDASSSEGLLVVRGEILRTPIVAEFVARAISTEMAVAARRLASGLRSHGTRTRWRHSNNAPRERHIYRPSRCTALDRRVAP